MYGSYRSYIARSVVNSKPAPKLSLEERLTKYGHADRIKDNLHARSDKELSHKPSMNFYVMQLMKKFNKGWLSDVDEGELQQVVWKWAQYIIERRAELAEENKNEHN